MADADSAPWWEALQRHELLIQRCRNCARLRWPARAICNDCHCADSSWISPVGSGTIASWTVTHRPGNDKFVVALVRLDDQDDILIPGYIDGPADGAGLNIGMPVHVGFDQVEISDDGWKLVVLRWRRDGQ
jgi:uncharacterized protein